MAVDFAALERAGSDFEDLTVEGKPVIQSMETDSLKYCYWRRGDGSITIAPNWPGEDRKFFNKGWTPLVEYGEFDKSEKHEGWDFRFSKYHRIFALHGAHEFPLEQILECGWLEKPPAVQMDGRRLRVNFPQLGGLKVEDLRGPDGETLPYVDCPAGRIYARRCPVCQKLLVSTSEDRVKLNLEKHESIAHADTHKEKSYGRALAEVLSQQKEARPDDPLIRAIEVLAVQVAQQGEALQALLREREHKK